MACFKVANTQLQNLKCEVRHLSAYNGPAPAGEHGQVRLPEIDGQAARRS